MSREVYEVDRTQHNARYLIIDNLYNQVSDLIPIGHIIGSAAEHVCFPMTHEGAALDAWREFYEANDAEGDS